MIKIDKTEVFGFSVAIRGLRNPMNSWDKSDSGFCPTLLESPYCYSGCKFFSEEDVCKTKCFTIGKNDLELACKLIKAGSDHRKFMRMIHVQADVLAPLYFWKQLDQYKVSTTTNSTSTMHKIHAKEFTIDDFSHEHLNFIKCGSSFHPFDQYLQEYIDVLNIARKEYLRTKDKDLWWVMIQMLPSSYNQLRTIDLNYEVLLNIYHARKNHKLDEWSGEKGFCSWIEQLPYMSDFLGLEEKNE